MKGLVLIYTLVMCVHYLNAGYYIGDYYVSHPLKLNWWQASRFCTFYGEDLIDIPDEREYKNILRVIEKVKVDDPKFNDHIWTSGARYNADKWFYWENTGMPVIYADWMANEPSMRVDEHFIALWSSAGYKLIDAFNSEIYVFMCRKRKLPVNRCEDCCNLDKCNCTLKDERKCGSPV